MRARWNLFVVAVLALLASWPAGAGMTGSKNVWAPTRGWLRLRAWLTRCAALLLVLPAVTWAAQFAYIPEYGGTFSGSHVSVIDLSNNAVSTITLGSNPYMYPYGVAVNPASTRVYVTNEGFSTVSVIDTASNTVTATISVGLTPEGVAVSPDGTRVYVANWNSNTVSVINATTNTLITSITVGINPAGVAVSPDGTTVYVTNEGVNYSPGTDGMVSVINVASNTVTASIRVHGKPEGIAVSPDGRTVYVANYNNNDVSVINTATNTVTTTIPVGFYPEGVAFNPSGTRVYVANQGSYPYGASTGSLSVIDTSTNSVTATVTAVGLGPVGVEVNPAGTRVYVANQGSWNVMAIDTATNAVVATVTVRGPRAYGKFIANIAAPPAPTKLAITGVNGGANPTVGLGFNVVVQAQDGSNTPEYVAANTVVSLSLLTGTGALGGTLGCTITAGSNTCTVTGVTYSLAEGGVSLAATRTSGDTLTAGNSVAFTVGAVVPPTIVKSFGAASIPLNGSTSLSFTINNPNASTTLTGVAFTDTLPAGLVVSTPNGLTGSCGSGTITATAGSGSISLASATLASSGSCTFSVNVTGSSLGTQNNVTGAVASVEGGSGGTASASVTVAAGGATPTTNIPALRPWALALLSLLLILTGSVALRATR
jgi:YVTN family beta-propeller protein